MRSSHVTHELQEFTHFNDLLSLCKGLMRYGFISQHPTTSDRIEFLAQGSGFLLLLINLLKAVLLHFVIDDRFWVAAAFAIVGANLACD